MNTESNELKPTRRTFIYTAGALAAGSVLPRAKAQAQTPVGANDRIGVGFIGCGGRGSHHAKELAAMRERGEAIELVAACDAYRPRMAALAERFQLKQHWIHHELLANADVDVVCVATPDHVHAPQAVDAVRAGKDVYCEKPFTHWRQIEITKTACDEIGKSDRVFQLGTQGMSDPAWHTMAKLVKEGLIGQPIHAECGYFRVGDWGERGMPIDDPNAKPGNDLNWEAFLGDAPKRDFDVSRYFRWRMYEDYSGGPVTDLFPHSLTPTVFMLGVSVPSQAVGIGGIYRYPEREVPDTFNMLLDYPEKLTLAVLGTQGNNLQGAHGRGSGGRCPHLRGWDGTLTVMPNPETKQDEVVFTAAEGAKKDAQRFPIEGKESVPEHWKNLLTCVRTREKPNSSIDLAYRVQTALQMAAHAARTGKTAKYDAESRAVIL
ncbi:MAG: Gfo/Idh/MocA family oxidoreductase [Candidatus Hydrogenedentes bacterium]|nr:Gfo/Idh/MocA family oxidoreductase [Candidatus Hydrogenedentota bacterium]